MRFQLSGLSQLDLLLHLRNWLVFVPVSVFISLSAHNFLIVPNPAPNMYQLRLPQLPHLHLISMLDLFAHFLPCFRSMQGFVSSTPLPDCRWTVPQLRVRELL